ncbi:hypothetical protein KBY27_05685 [Ruegeria pomeroyi]|uniref:Uncharacterized protein n=1 Tax=Ruegeria pomeroyi TaxID=89184 RepID=A0A9Q3ZLF3_9RHOB|nr:hypothetical protein [Ruegeria pomeroyi]MCE8536938.1 hypothetical protein [Ruegeria pomeroyi]
MHTPIYRPQRRLSGVLSLVDLVRLTWSSNAHAPRFLTWARLRRDTGVLEIAGEPTVHPMLHRKT